MPLCKCKQCLLSTNGQGRELHRTCINRHRKNEQINQELEDQYQNLYSEEDFMQTDEFEVQDLDNDKILFEGSYYDNEEVNYNNEEASISDFYEQNLDNDEILFEDSYDNE